MAHYYELTVRVLTDSPLPHDISLAEIARDICEGDSMGDWMIEQEESRVLDEKETYEMELELGGDGGMFAPIPEEKE